MKYNITHTTKYKYDSSVAACQNIVLLTPRTTANQACNSNRLSVSPTPESALNRLDYFGNSVCTFAITESHRELEVIARSEVLLQKKEAPSVAGDPWERIAQQIRLDHSQPGIATYQHAFISPYVPIEPELASYARESFVANRPVIDAVMELNTRIFSDVTYDPKATTVSTPVMEVFQNRRGVCQDLAHMMIGCLRSIGLAARYVSGYLRTYPPKGKPRLVGADASHAWVSVYCGASGWIDLDPTNNSLPNTDHVTLGWGRDFGDVCPVSGMFVGGGDHLLSVSVDVAPEEN